MKAWRTSSHRTPFGKRTGRYFRRSQEVDYASFFVIGFLVLMLIIFALGTGHPLGIAFAIIPPVAFLALFRLAVHYAYKLGYSQGDKVSLQDALIPPPEARKRKWMIRRSEDPTSPDDVVMEHIISSVVYVFIAGGIFWASGFIFGAFYSQIFIYIVLILAGLAYLVICFLTLRRARRLGYKTAVRLTSLGKSVRAEEASVEAE